MSIPVRSTTRQPQPQEPHPNAIFRGFCQRFVGAMRDGIDPAEQKQHLDEIRRDLDEQDVIAQNQQAQQHEQPRLRTY